MNTTFADPATNNSRHMRSSAGVSSVCDLPHAQPSYFAHSCHLFAAHRILVPHVTESLSQSVAQSQSGVWRGSEAAATLGDLVTETSTDYG
eukprot:1188685-Prorocentrum_minimum.AAC.3